jgi:hypothetical protein
MAIMNGKDLCEDLEGCGGGKFSILFRNSPKVSQENHQKPVRIVGNLVDNETGFLSNKNVELHC